MHRNVLIQLTRIRIKEAKQLLISKNYSGAYYLAGYSIECALKACISKQIQQYEIPDKKFIIDCFTHNIKDLVKLAGKEKERSDLEKNNANFAVNWAIVKDWNETSRYNIYNEIQAKELYKSITSKNGGVLKWIQTFW